MGKVLSAFWSETKANRPFDASNPQSSLGSFVNTNMLRRPEDHMLFLYVESPVDYTPADMIPKHTG